MKPIALNLLPKLNASRIVLDLPNHVVLKIIKPFFDDYDLATIKSLHTLTKSWRIWVLSSTSWKAFSFAKELEHSFVEVLVDKQLLKVRSLIQDWMIAFANRNRSLGN